MIIVIQTQTTKHGSGLFVLNFPTKMATKPDYSFQEERTHTSIFNPTSNIEFDPLPSTPGKCPKLKINIALDSNHYRAGTALTGRLEITSLTNDDLLLGLIQIQLLGFEEIQGKHSNQSITFLSSKLKFQGKECRPSEAVRGPCKNGYYTANKGKTVFSFNP